MAKKKVVKKKAIAKRPKRDLEKARKETTPPQREEKLAPGAENILKLKTWQEVLQAEKAPTHPGEDYRPGVNDKYPAPSDNKIFIARWNDYLPTIVGRPKFHVSQLAQLELLCNLYVEIHRLETFLNANGYTIPVISGRAGAHLKPNPMVSQLNKSRALVPTYLRMLDVGTVKSEKAEDDGADFGGGDEDDWD